MNKKKKNNKDIWKTLSGNILIWLLIIIMSITALQYFSNDYKSEVLDYTQFQQYLDDDQIYVSDINNDQLINVLDVILLVNLILDN